MVDARAGEVVFEDMRSAYVDILQGKYVREVYTRHEFDESGWKMKTG
jgi:hypothetical protein